MKQLSIEEKAKRYDEAIEVAQRFYNNSVAITKKGLEDIFPTLAESEDEKIRKALISFLKSPFVSENITDEKVTPWIAWLEKQKVLTTEEDPQGKEDVLWCIKQAKKHAKDENEMGTCWFAEKWLERQGEKKSLDDIATEVTKDKDVAISFLKSTGIINENGELADEYKIEQGEQKSADKVEPKFKVGDFVIGAYCAGKIIELTDDAYLLDTEQGIPFSSEHNMRLWTIQDAKAGSILEYQGEVFIIKELKKKVIASRTIEYYCCYDGEHFINNSIYSIMDDDLVTIRPATKEQRDLLFQKMKEAGYEWDAEKKELKKIENRNPMLSDFFKAEYERGKSDAQNPVEWSEEDEENFKWFEKFFRAESVIAGGKNIPQDRYLWFKNLKDRVQPQPKQEWSEEDEKIIIQIKKALEDFFSASETDKIKYWLESLKYRIQPQSKQEWKQENTDDLTDFENAMMHIGGSFFGDNAGLDPNDTNAIKEQANFLLELALSKEWSKENEKILDGVITNYESGYLPSVEKRDEIIEKLKSLKDRYTWKPSDEQMVAINTAINVFGKGTLSGKQLIELQEQLKKLKE